MPAANPIRGETRCTIGGTEFVLVPSFARLAKLEDMMGRSVVQFLQELRENHRITVAELASAIEILAAKPKLSLEQIGPLVLKNGLVPTVIAVVRCVGAVIDGPKPEPEEGEEGGEGKGEGGDAPSGE